jgi:uncharacterized membrane protein (UPF0136 family)
MTCSGEAATLGRLLSWSSMAAAVLKSKDHTMRHLIALVPWTLIVLLALAAFRLAPSRTDVPIRAAAPAGSGSHFFPALVDAGPIH